MWKLQELANSYPKSFVLAAVVFMVVLGCGIAWINSLNKRRQLEIQLEMLCGLLSSGRVIAIQWGRTSGDFWSQAAGDGWRFMFDRESLVDTRRDKGRLPPEISYAFEAGGLYGGLDTRLLEQLSDEMRKDKHFIVHIDATSGLIRRAGKIPLVAA